MKTKILLLTTALLATWHLTLDTCSAQLVIAGTVPVTTPTTTNLVVTRFVVGDSRIKTHVTPRATNEVMVIQGIANNTQPATVILTNPADIGLCAGVLAQTGPNQDIIAAIGTNSATLGNLELALSRAKIRLH